MKERLSVLSVLVPHTFLNVSLYLFFQILKSSLGGEHRRHRRLMGARGEVKWAAVPNRQEREPTMKKRGRKIVPQSCVCGQPITHPPIPPGTPWPGDNSRIPA